jgi:release factor glutamine methyltransferase
MESLFDIQNNIIEILKNKIKLSTREARIEARFILEHELKMNHAGLISNQLLPIKQKNKNKIYKILEERIQHKPLAHIIGEWEFYGLNFFVSQETLIPRQDTELLIDLVLKKYPPKQEINILDLGTGSGIIGITLAKKIPKSHVII